MTLEDDPVLGRFFDTAEKKARWIARLRLAYILWIIFMVCGILFFFMWYVFR